jgi:CHAT domain-containing protein/tetratricopeptide (TPR) repeat protein
MVNYSASEPQTLQALEIRRRVLGEEHPDFAASLSSLAELYRSMGNYEAAEPLYLQALEIRRRVLGEEHPDFAASLNNLAELYRSIGNYAAAEPLYLQALEIRRRVLGEEHPAFATSLNNLATLYYSIGKYGAAEPLYRQVLEIERRVLGEEHPAFATSLNNLATLCAATGRLGEAYSCFVSCSHTRDTVLAEILSSAAESHRAAFLVKLRPEVDGFLSFVLEHFADSPSHVTAALDLLLGRKAMGLEVTATQRHALLSGRYPELAERIKDLSILQAQIVRKRLDGPGSEDLKAHGERLAEWEDRRDWLEAELAREIPEMRLEHRLRTVDREAVALALPQDCALLEFVRVHCFDFRAVPARGEHQWKPARYLAFVLVADRTQEVRLLDLGPAAAIDEMILTFRKLMAEGDRGRPSSASIDDASGSSGLTRSLADPLAAAARGHKRLFLAPDSTLATLPFELLEQSNGRLLTEDFEISYLSTGRDLLRFGVESTITPVEPLVAADPAFEMAGAGPEVEARSNQERVDRRAIREQGVTFARLPGSGVEGERIARKLEVSAWLGEEVMETRLKQRRSPRVLHLSTHGFFLPDVKRDLEAEWRMQSLGAEQRLRMLPHDQNPMLRSGLALSGAETWLRGAALPEEAEDGLLFAEDVAGMDLSATEIVVLSACETGLGESKTGDGVYGLRRAFVLAGAKTLVMSLWKVPDMATAILMDRFYDHLLAGEWRHQALRQAQRDLREMRVDAMRETWLSDEMIDRFAPDQAGKRELKWLRAHPDDHRPFEHPFYWGAFICQGETAPLTLSPIPSDTTDDRRSPSIS